jgi:hypothetical protein
LCYDYHTMIDAPGNALSLLIAERDRLNQAIAILQGGSLVPASAPKRRGRPPGSKNKVAVAPKSAASNMSDEARKAVSARMKKYWAKRRKEK